MEHIYIDICSECVASVKNCILLLGSILAVLSIHQTPKSADSGFFRLTCPASMYGNIPLTSGNVVHHEKGLEKDTLIIISSITNILQNMYLRVSKTEPHQNVFFFLFFFTSAFDSSN